jgi:phosphoenolpyruvate synthase/pyruvate phosphate dikinase
MDIEWGKDGDTGKIYILQARPETVQSRAGRTIQRFTLKSRSTLRGHGRSIGQRIGAGPARIIKDVKEMSRVRAGDVLVADMTDPDWEPVMKRASAIVTNRGGRTCHAAIIARELGIPAVVGCGTATSAIKEGPTGHRLLRRGRYRLRVRRHARIRPAQHRTGFLPPIPVKIMMNVGNPDRAFDFAGIPHKGVGLARLEFIINRMIGVHPRALLEFDKQSAELKDTIQADRRLRGPGQFLRRQADRRHCADRRGLRARAGHRASLGFQVERICEPDRRQELRAARGESHARISRRIALHRQGVPALLRTRMPGAEARARRDGPHQRAGHGAVRAHA